MVWGKCLINFFLKCCGKKTDEFDTLTNDQMASFQSTYTVRRISSFGQTIINENGEECEIGRHSNIITYDGEPVPWSSKLAPVQPGVTHSDIANQINKLPTINETPRKPKTKHKWKKGDTKDKKDLFPKFGKDNSYSENLLLSPLKNSDKKKKLLESNSVSQDDIFGKCKLKVEGKSLTANMLTLPTMKNSSKSVSSPDLVNCESTTQPDIKYIFKEISPSLDLKYGQNNEKPIFNKKDLKRTESEKIAKLHGLNLSLYTEEALIPLNINPKHPTAMKIETWIDEPTAILDVSLNFNSLQKLINVTVNAVQSLCGEGMDRQPFPVIVKLTMLGKKKVMKHTKRTQASLNPIIDQAFSFSTKDIDSRFLRFSVYNAEWQGKYDAVGHSSVPIHDNLHSTDNLLLKLYQMQSLEKSVGMIQVNFGYDGVIFSLTVEKIFNFDPKIKKHKLFIKISYYSLSKKIKEKTSPLTWAESGSEEIYFNYGASFKIDPSGKSHSYLLISVKRNEDHTMFKQDKTVGRIILGPYFYSESRNLTPWGRAIINQQSHSNAFKLHL